MPTYVYRCDNCEAATEHTHGMQESPEVQCQRCWKPMRKSIQPALLHYSAIPTRMTRFKREEAQRIRGNTEMLEGVKGAYSDKAVAYRKNQARKNAAVQRRVAERLRNKKK